MKRKINFSLLVMIMVLGGGLILFLSGRNFLGFRTKLGCPCSNLETAKGDFEEGEKQAYFGGLEILPLLAQLPEPDEKVMGVAAGDKWIEIDLSDQKLIAWEGDRKILESLVSTGKMYPTPTGEFQIWSKFKYTKMSGGTRGTSSYYYLPNVPYTMYFNGGFGIHGTYWHNNFGQPMSHGCVNAPTMIAEKLFYWADPAVPFGKNSIRADSSNVGTKVIVHQ